MVFESISFKPDTNIVMACHFTGIYDVNRNTILDNDNYELVRNWAESVANCNLRGIIFHNNFSDATCEKYRNEYISFVRVECNPKYSPNVYRYFVYCNFLSTYVHTFKGVFVTDISDVEVVNNPFIDPFLYL